MHPSRMFSFELTLEQLKHPWSSENAFSVFAKSLALHEALTKIREKWITIPLICQRQLMMMLASELEANCSIASHFQTLGSHVLMSENADDWLRYLASSSRCMSETMMLCVQPQSLFCSHLQLLPRTTLPDESAACTSGQSGDSADVVARAATVSKTNHFVQKPIRFTMTAPAVAAISAPTISEVYKPKNIAELVDFDAEEPDVKKGSQKKKRCR